MRTWRHVQVLIWHGYFSMAEPKFGSHGEPLRLRGLWWCKQAGAKDTLYVLYNFWVLTISVRRLDAFLERECMSHWVELMYHCEWAPGWQCFQPASLKRAENIANLAPCPGSNLTWVLFYGWAEIWFPWRTTTTTRLWWCKQAGAKDTLYVLYNFWVLTISVRRLDAFLERECMSHWVELMYHCEWCQVGNVFSSIF